MRVTCYNRNFQEVDSPLCTVWSPPVKALPWAQTPARIWNISSSLWNQIHTRLEFSTHSPLSHQTVLGSRGGRANLCILAAQSIALNWNLLIQWLMALVPSLYTSSKQISYGVRRPARTEGLWIAEESQFASALDVDTLSPFSGHGSVWLYLIWVTASNPYGKLLDLLVKCGWEEQDLHRGSLRPHSGDHSDWVRCKPVLLHQGKAINGGHQFVYLGVCQVKIAHRAVEPIRFASRAVDTSNDTTGDIHGNIQHAELGFDSIAMLRDLITTDCSKTGMQNEIWHQ